MWAHILLEPGRSSLEKDPGAEKCYTKIHIQTGLTVSSSTCYSYYLSSPLVVLCLDLTVHVFHILDLETHAGLFRQLSQTIDEDVVSLVR